MVDPREPRSDLNSVPGGTGPVPPGTGFRFWSCRNTRVPGGTAPVVPGGTGAVPPGTGGNLGPAGKWPCTWLLFPSGTKAVPAGTKPLEFLEVGPEPGSWGNWPSSAGN